MLVDIFSEKYGESLSAIMAMVGLAFHKHAIGFGVDASFRAPSCTKPCNATGQ